MGIELKRMQIVAGIHLIVREFRIVCRRPPDTRRSRGVIDVVVNRPARDPVRAIHHLNAGLRRHIEDIIRDERIRRQRDRMSLV